MAPKQGYDSYGQKIGGSQYIPIPGATGATMSTGMNSYQIAGLIGSTTSNVLSTYNTYMSAQSTAMQLGSQAGSVEAAGILESAGIIADSELRAVLREQEQQELSYNSQRYQIEADMLNVNKEISNAKAEATARDITRNLNKADENTVLMAIAQGRTGATVENLRAQNRDRANKEIEMAKELNKMETASISGAQSEALLNSKLSALASTSSQAVGAYETETAQIKSRYVSESSKITAESLRSQAKYARKMGTINTYIGAAGTLGSLAGRG